MKIVRYIAASDGATRWGRWVEPLVAERIEGSLFADWSPTGRTDRIAKLLAPVQPPLIVGIGLNYRRHAEETGGKPPEWPVVFYKSPASLQNPGDPIRLPRRIPTEEVDYECELAVVLGREARDLPRERALQHVLGYTVANDVSARDWQLRRSGRQWCRAKSFDTFCPLGPCLVTADELPDPSALRLGTRLNGDTMQDWTTADLIFDVPALLEFLTADTTLPPGTVILTGTPHGVGMARNPPVWLRPGDSITVWVEGIGELTNPVE
ncbi:MAG: fumarylacetoacetate hydrolase family protein [Fimbriimonadales bacterium]|nr:fumarylacetoacetate hydrolase family protein [Fimbriimonadales bacterium]